MSENVEYQIKCLKVGLDKLTLTVTPHDMTPYGDFVKQLKCVAKYDDDITFASAGAQAGYRFAGRLKIPSMSSTAWPFIQVAPYGKGPYLRLECNPNRLGPGGIDEMKNIIESNMPHGWPLFMHGARASRIDVNIDVQGLPLDRILVRTKYPRCTEIWSQKGELDDVGIGAVTTIYLGQKGQSKDIFRIYRLCPSKIDSGCSDATRFESVDGTAHPLLSQLHAYGFPFGKLVVRSALAPKPPGWPEGMWKLWIRSAADHGLNVALQHLTDQERKHVDKSLESMPVTDLDLQQAWSQWPSLIQNLGIQKPGFHGAFLPGFSSAKLAA